MIPNELTARISSRLIEEVGFREDIGKFVYTFAAAPSGHDVDYALDELKRSTDQTYKKAINIVLEEITK